MDSNSSEFEVIDSATQEKIKMIIIGKAKQLAPAHIAPYIRSDDSEITQKNNTYSVKIVARVADYKKYPGRADARAQEFGSGIHSTKNFKSPHQETLNGTIRIAPVKKKVLAFFWDKLTDSYDAWSMAESNKVGRDVPPDPETGWSNLDPNKRYRMFTAYYPANYRGSGNKAGPGLAVTEVLPSKGKIRGMTRDGRVMMSHVDHPGIPPYRGRGYMRPAFEESYSQIRDLVGENAMKNLVIKGRAVFTRPGGLKK